MRFEPPPRDPPGLDFAFAMRLQFSPRVKMGRMPNGFLRGYTGVVGGEVVGPMLNGEVVPHSGGDWPAYWDNGTVEFTAQYMLRAEDGTPILLKNRGFRHAPAEVCARMERLDPVEPEEYYMRLAPFFEAPVGPHDWMNQHVFVGSAQRRTDHSIFHFWIVR